MDENFLQLERQILGQMLIPDTSKGLIFQALLALRPEYFTSQNAPIFAAINAVSRRGDHVDDVMVIDELMRMNALVRAGGAAYVSSLEIEAPTNANLLQHVAILRNRCVSRDVMGVLGDIREEIRKGAEPLAAFGNAMTRVASIVGSGTDSKTIAEGAQSVLAELKGRAAGTTKGRGIKTGYRDVDAVFGKWMPGCVTIVGAGTGCGKTAFAMGIAQHVAETTQQKVMVYSGEMLNEELSARLLSSNALVSSGKIRDAKLEPFEMDRLEAANRRLQESLIQVFDQKRTIEKIALEVQMAAAQGNLALVVIDYLQLMDTERKGRSKYDEVTEISKALKRDIAKLSKVHVLALAQLNRAREQRSDKKPRKEDLRESGQIEQDADNIILLHRDEETPSVADVIVAKQRNGELANFKMKFQGEYTKYEDY